MVFEKVMAQATLRRFMITNILRRLKCRCKKRNQSVKKNKIRKNPIKTRNGGGL